jgi:hypothetical protein
MGSDTPTALRSCRSLLLVIYVVEGPDAKVA